MLHWPLRQQEMQLRVYDNAAPEQILSTASLSVTPTDQAGGSMPQNSFTLSPAIQVEEEHNYTFELLSTAEQGSFTLRGSATANETDWDDGLPLRIDGFDGYGGIYQRELNFQMYWDDNADKLARFERVLNDSEYIFISSSRQWGTVTRIPERWPLTSTYYRNLLGCPDERTIEWCYTVAQPDSFEGNLGFELVQVFEERPSIFSFTINDQFAEEAFTVYDHPKVFIFQKTEQYLFRRISARYFGRRRPQSSYSTDAEAGFRPRAHRCRCPTCSYHLSNWKFNRAAAPGLNFSIRIRFSTAFSP